MEKEAFEKLIADKPHSVKVKGVALFNAHAKAFGAYQSDPTTAHLRDWQSAEAALNEFAAEIGDESGSFANREQVLAYLKTEGWKATKSSLQRHFDEGKFSARNGLFSRKDIDRYAKTWLKEAATGKHAQGASENLQRQRQEKEIKLLDIRIKKEQQALDQQAKKLLPRDQIEIELAGRAVILDAGLHHWIHTSAMEWIRLVSGDEKRVNELLHVMSRSLDEHINTYAQPIDYRILLEDEVAIAESPEEKEEEADEL